VSEWSDVPGYLMFLFNGASEEQAAIWPPNPVEPLVLAVVLVLYGYLLFRGLYDSPGIRGGRLLKREMLLSPGLVLGLWLVVPFAGLFLLSLSLKPVLMFRVMVIAFPAAYLLLARGIVRLPVRPVAQNGLALVGAGLLLVQVLFVLDYYTEPHKDQIREVTRFIARNEWPHALIAYSGTNGENFAYYGERYGIDFQQEPQMQLPPAGGAPPVPALERELNRGDYRYVIYMRARGGTEQSGIGFLAPLLRSGDIELIEQKRLLKAKGFVFRVGEDIRE
jgi:mannosyltransferase